MQRRQPQPLMKETPNEPLSLPNSQKETRVLPLPSLPSGETSEQESLTAFERAELRLLRENFNLQNTQIAQWIAVARQRDQEMELTLGKMRAFAELTERIVDGANAQLEQLVTLVAALLTFYQSLQENPPKVPPAQQG